MRKSKIPIIILFLVAIFSIIYVISTGGSFIKDIIYYKKAKLNEIRVEVLNGTKIKGLASTVAEFLIKKGFDVIDYSNAEKTVSKTVIIDRTDIGAKNARIVKRALRQGEITFETHPLQIVDVTIVIGEDFNIKKVK